MISNFFAKYKLIFYVIALISIISFFGLLYNNYKTALSDNEKLKEKIVQKDIKIDELEKDSKFKQNTINSIKEKLIEVTQILEERNRNVKKKVESSKKFQDDTLSTINSPKSDIKIDIYLVDRYNTILECIEKVTKDEQDNC